MDVSMSARVSWWPAQPDELAALKDEISCLRRVGIPLAEGLREVAQDQPERLSQIALWVAERLEDGVKLADALDALALVTSTHVAVSQTTWRRNVG
jgi:type II secretory pathway component PulF